MDSQIASQKNSASDSSQEHRKRGRLGIILTILVLLFLGYFSYRVVYYLSLISDGDIQAIQESFSEYQTFSRNLENVTIPQGLFDVATSDDPSFGPEDASVVIVEFADFGCVYSQGESYIVRALMQEYQDRIRFVYRDFPMTDLHPIAQKAAEAGECANAQGKFWEYHDQLYQNQSDLSEEQLVAYATKVNLDTEAFRTCLESGEFADEVLEDYQDGAQAGVRGTPTFFINGNRIAGAIPQSVLLLLIKNALGEEEGN